MIQGYIHICFILIERQNAFILFFYFYGTSLLGSMLNYSKKCSWGHSDMPSHEVHNFDGNPGHMKQKQRKHNGQFFVKVLGTKYNIWKSLG